MSSDRADKPDKQSAANGSYKGSRHEHPHSAPMPLTSYLLLLAHRADEIDLDQKLIHALSRICSELSVALGSKALLGTSPIFAKRRNF
jgi:hypothetical protein